MRKLIRDRYINEIDKKDLDITGTEVERRELLIEKLDEEINELADSGFKDIEEYADVFEVLHSLAKIHGIGIPYINSLQIEKRYKKGGFDNGLILIRPDEEDK